MGSLSQFITFAIVLTASSALVTPSNTKDIISKGKRSLFDPIFGFDEFDADIVLAPSVLTSANKSKPVPPEPQQQKPRDQLLDNVDQTSTRRPPETVADVTRAPTESAPTTSSSPAPTLVPIKPRFGAATRPPRAKKQHEEQKPAHWSAIEDYYRKLRVHDPPGAYPLPPFYLWDRDDSPLKNFRYPTAKTAPKLIETDVTFKMDPQLVVPEIIERKIGQTVKSDGQGTPEYIRIPPRPDGQSLPEFIRLASRPDGKVPTEYTRSSSRPDGQAPPEFIRSPPTGLPDDAIHSSRPSSTIDGTETRRPDILDWRKLPDLLREQVEQRAKHQKETFGSWYDYQRSKDLLQEEAFCGQRNSISYLAATTNGTLNGPNGSSLPAAYQLASEFKQQARQHLNDNSSGGAGEYPSHMGVYNGTPSESNFLCGATWIHESFALTLASCVKSVDPKMLTVRAGEWNLNKESVAERPLIWLRIEQVFTFPNFSATDNEHNLALIKFIRPIDYVAFPYVCPACQAHLRASIKSSSCWAPGRRVTTSDYFDPEGEGETKAKEAINMIEAPVQLSANDEQGCKRQTGVEFFNFRYPNYICSANVRKADWRVKLNRSEYFGSGIYCNEGGILSLVSIIHPIHLNSSSAFGYMDLHYYKPWMRYIISGHNY